MNNDVLAEKNLEAPKTWEDLADPKYKDEIIMASPAISGTQYAILNGTLQAWGEEGWDIWGKINDNVDFYARAAADRPQDLRWQYGIAILAMTGGTFALEEELPGHCHLPWDMIPWTPAPSPSSEFPRTKEAAKVFVDYMLSKRDRKPCVKPMLRIMARGDGGPSAISTVDTTKMIKQDVTLFGSQRRPCLKMGCPRR